MPSRRLSSRVDSPSPSHCASSRGPSPCPFARRPVAVSSPARDLARDLSCCIANHPSRGTSLATRLRCGDRRLLLPLVAARRLFNLFNLRLLCSARLLLEQSRGGPDRHLLPLVAAPRLFSLQLPCSARLLGTEQRRSCTFSK